MKAIKTFLFTSLMVFLPVILSAIFNGLLAGNSIRTDRKRKTD